MNELPLLSAMTTSIVPLASLPVDSINYADSPSEWPLKSFPNIQTMETARAALNNWEEAHMNDWRKRVKSDRESDTRTMERVAADAKWELKEKAEKKSANAKLAVIFSGQVTVKRVHLTDFIAVVVRTAHIKKLLDLQESTTWAPRFSSDLEKCAPSGVNERQISSTLSAFPMMWLSTDALDSAIKHLVVPHLCTSYNSRTDD